jgi:hypothetical protein
MGLAAGCGAASTSPLSLRHLSASAQRAAQWRMQLVQAFSALIGVVYRRRADVRPVPPDSLIHVPRNPREDFDLSTRTY